MEANLVPPSILTDRLSSLGDVELQTTYTAVIKEIQHRATQANPKLVLLCTDDYMVRKHGGWTKSVTGLNKKVTTGYSIEGNFKITKRNEYYQVGKLYLDCGKGGSWKNPVITYTLFTVEEHESNPMVTLFETDSLSWATELWQPIEAYWEANPAFAPMTVA